MVARQGQPVRRLFPGQRNDGHRPPQIEPEPLQGRPGLVLIERPRHELLEEVALQPAFGLRDRPRLAELDGQQGEGMAEHDAVELGEGVPLPQGEERLHSPLCRHRLDRHVVAALHHREAETSTFGAR